MVKRHAHVLLALVALAGFLLGWFAFKKPLPSQPKLRPNFLLIITDDQSWIHTSYAGYPAVQTPNFDRLANEGVYFDNAYASAPTCTASRSALLTGQHFWRLGSAGVLWGEFPAALKTYQAILAEHGYKTGYTGKGWGPGKSAGGNPAGPDYNRARRDVDPTLSRNDHVENFRQFLQERDPQQPFSFWISPTEPHRPFHPNIGVDSGEIDISKVVVPPFLPDEPVVRNDIADYLYEIQWFDKELGRILQLLEEQGELDNTVIVYTSDNGMAFPRAKSNNYDYGTHVPLAVRWGSGIEEHQQVTDFISLTDLAPTFLELAGITVPDAMTGRSFVRQLLAERSGRIDKQRDSVLTGFQRHIDSARLESRGYPARAIHTDRYLLIENLAADRWPAGRPPTLADIDDGSPSKNLLVLQKDNHQFFWDLAAAKRPAQEFYAVERDPGQIHDLSAEAELAPVRQALSARLLQSLKETGDPCVLQTTCDVFDAFPYYGGGKE